MALGRIECNHRLTVMSDKHKIVALWPFSVVLPDRRCENLFLAVRRLYLGLKISYFLSLKLFVCTTTSQKGKKQN